MTTDTNKQRLCPFGTAARDCKHQETWTKNLTSAIKGDIIIVCTLDGTIKCLRMKEMVNRILDE